MRRGEGGRGGQAWSNARLGDALRLKQVALSAWAPQSSAGRLRTGRFLRHALYVITLVSLSSMRCHSLLGVVAGMPRTRPRKAPNASCDTTPGTPLRMGRRHKA